MAASASASRHRLVAPRLLLLLLLSLLLFLLLLLVLLLSLLVLAAVLLPLLDTAPNRTDRSGTLAQSFRRRRRLRRGLHVKKKETKEGPPRQQEPCAL
jgi:hypothetical protein